MDYKRLQIEGTSKEVDIYSSGWQDYDYTLVIGLSRCAVKAEDIEMMVQSLQAIKRHHEGISITEEEEVLWHRPGYKVEAIRSYRNRNLHMSIREVKDMFNKRYPECQSTF